MEETRPQDCIFCKIAKGEIPSEKVLETDNMVIIKDIHPKVPGHSLVIPKKHYKTFLDMPSSLFGEFLDDAKKAALKLIEEQKAEGFNLIMNNYEVAGQVVPHAHLHILPRKKGDGFKVGV
jgi:histidine triad (HIT) family protein